MVTTIQDFEDFWEGFEEEYPQLLFSQYVGDFKTAGEEIDDTIDLINDPSISDINDQLMYIIANLQNIANEYPPTTFKPTTCRESVISSHVT